MMRPLNDREVGPFVPRCRKCRVAYGWDRVVPHHSKCPYASRGTAGVLADDCDWPA